jgi:hypothetical protein
MGADAKKVNASSGEIISIFGSPAFVSGSWTWHGQPGWQCKKQKLQISEHNTHHTPRRVNGELDLRSLSKRFTICPVAG